MRVLIVALLLLCSCETRYTCTPEQAERVDQFMKDHVQEAVNHALQARGMQLFCTEEAGK